MGDLPSGTVIFLFTDIEGSTRLLHELGDGYAGALADHRAILRRAFAEWGGVEVDTQGDALFYAFARASDAVSAAAAGQRALAGGPVSVRMGLHTGEPQTTAEGYVGVAVHAGARIAAAGHGGQTVISAHTRELAGDGHEFTDLGLHRLKDLDAPVRLYQLGAAGFPPLRSLSVTNLPMPASSFVGRRHELAEAAALLARARLLTITGPGGSGKTRLAIALAGGAPDAFPAGVFWVPLAGVRDPRLVLAGAEQALHARDGLARHIGDRRMLLLLDNFEHVTAAAPELVPVLEACPGLTLLVTSRELLRVEGEHEYPLAPLAADEGVELFCDRATVEPSDTIAELCRRLDGLPLAIELAAPRLRLFTPDQLVGRLGRRLDLLRGGRGSDPRHATLRATIEWSYELLPEDEQQLFARLSAFAGGCTVEAAEEVAGARVDSLQGLLGKSLLRRTRDRIWMLETIREYAAERLDAAGESEAIARRLYDFLLALAEAANLEQDSIGESRYTVVADELANITSALEWASARGHAELGLRLTLAVGTGWLTTDTGAGIRRFREFLAADGIPARLRAPALRTYGGMADHVGDPALAARLYEQSLADYRLLGDDAGVAIVLVHLAHSTWYRGEPEAANTLAVEALEATTRVGNERGAVQALGLLGDLAVERGERDEGMRMLEQSAARAGAAGFPWWQARMLLRLGKRAHEAGRAADAAAYARESLRVAAAIGDLRRLMQLLDLLAMLAAEEGAVERAGRLRGALEAAMEREPQPGVTPSGLPEALSANAAFESERQAGALLSLDEAVALAESGEAPG